MKYRILSVIAIAVLLFNTAGSALADTRGNALAKKRAAARLVSLLPASDAIAVFDAKRFLGEALPTLLSSNQPMLGEIMAKMREIEDRTGIDLRKFEQVAVGVAFKHVSATEVDYEPVAIANGDINAGALAAVGKLASKGAYREEKVGTRTVYVFSAKDAVAKTPSPVSNSKIAASLEKLLSGLDRKEIAVTAYDANTLVIGSPARVRQTLGAARAVKDADVRGLLPAAGTSVFSFAARTNGYLTKLLPVDADSLGANLESIQYLTGSLGVTAGSTSLQIMARTKKPQQAASLKDTLEGLQMVGQAFLGSSKGPDKQVYGRMVKNVRFAVRANDVTIDLTVPQADIDILIGAMK